MLGWGWGHFEILTNDYFHDVSICSLFSAFADHEDHEKCFNNFPKWNPGEPIPMNYANRFDDKQQIKPQIDESL